MICKSVVVLISGSGSNLQAIMDAARDQAHFRVAGVISNKADAYGLTRAQNAGIPTAVISHKDYPDRDSFDQALMQQIDSWQANLVVLAGFMRILTDDFVRHYAGRMINIHPSLLPKYKGLNTHQRALDAGDTEHGCTVHFVSEQLDAGHPIIQSACAVSPNDTAQTLAERIHQLEHQIYPLAVDWFCAGRLQETTEGVLLDNQLLGSGGYRYSASL